RHGTGFLCRSGIIAMVSTIAFSCFIVVLAAQRLFELKKSEEHRRRLLMRGGREHGTGHFPFMALLHALWLIAMPLEVWLLDRPAYFFLALFAGVLFLLGQIFRLLAMRELGERWCARIITLPERPAITTGIFSYLRHPNYLGVVLEIAAAPMLHTAYVTATVFSILNGLILWVRIKEEEKALDVDNNYWASFKTLNKGR
ncbi:MAG TPA: isoprenylcysteine carboxylmethyltransferase family protein, partial [Myxococcota bacterium]|nr:isoprenylcysteine carboxylmethyltransferase family protein [Myxococcota bacterium]